MIHPAVHVKKKFGLAKTKVEPGMIVEFMYTSRTRSSNTSLRHLLVLDPKFKRSDGKGGMYMWGIDLGDIAPSQFATLLSGYEIIAGGPKSTERKLSVNVPVIQIPGGTGLQRYSSIRTTPLFLKNYRSYDFAKIAAVKAVQYSFSKKDRYDPSLYEDNILGRPGFEEVGSTGEYIDIVTSIDSQKQFGKRNRKKETQEKGAMDQAGNQGAIAGAKEGTPDGI